MKNKKKTALIIAAVIIAAVIVSAALIIHNKDSGSTPLENITVSESVLPSHPLKIEDETSELTAAADSNAKPTADISSVKGTWWYLYNDEQKYVMPFTSAITAELTWHILTVTFCREMIIKADTVFTRRMERILFCVTCRTVFRLKILHSP